MKFLTTSKKCIQDDREELHHKVIPTYEDIENELEMQIASLDGEYKKLTTGMSKQREEIHREVDNAINRMEKEIDEIKVKHHSISTQSFIQQTLITLNKMEESNEVSSIIKYSSKNKEFSKLPPNIYVLMPSFIGTQIEKEELSNLIGKLTPLSTKMEERVFTAKKPNTSVRELLDEPEVLNPIKTGYDDLYGVTCLNEEHIWTSEGTFAIFAFAFAILTFEVYSRRQSEQSLRGVLLI